jgi:L-alanine-DL-glutamate epimerase-like enolase superfamily enzyme
MKITDIQAVYPNYRQPLGGWRPYLWQIVVRVETDGGVTGYGYGGGGVAAVEVVNRHLRELLLGGTSALTPPAMTRNGSPYTKGLLCDET